MERTAVTIKGEKILREMYTMDECKAMLEANPLGVARLMGIAERGLRQDRARAKDPSKARLRGFEDS